MLNFSCDYLEGAHPKVLQALVDHNLEQVNGYGRDPYSDRARDKIRAACACPQAEVFFLTGGTQANATVIDFLLSGYQGAVCVQSGHIATHEAGAIEAGGHKVLPLPGEAGKLSASTLSDYLAAFYADESWEHAVEPGMVYLSQPTEYGTLYSLEELSALRAVCGRYQLPLYVDGARLGYALAAEENDVTLHDLARLCDVFYIGGTKVGALCGEAVVFPDPQRARRFFTVVKQHGALLAKGRLNALQFDALFTDGLYLQLGRHALEMARRLREGLHRRSCSFFLETPTNQQFLRLTSAQLTKLREAQVGVTVWQLLPDGGAVVRLVTSWATQPEAVDALLGLL